MAARRTKPTRAVALSTSSQAALLISHREVADSMPPARKDRPCSTYRHIGLTLTSRVSISDEAGANSRTLVTTRRDVVAIWERLRLCFLWLDRGNDRLRQAFQQLPWAFHPRDLRRPKNGMDERKRYDRFTESVMGSFTSEDQGILPVMPGHARIVPDFWTQEVIALISNIRKQLCPIGRPLFIHMTPA